MTGTRYCPRPRAVYAERWSPDDKAAIGSVIGLLISHDIAHTYTPPTPGTPAALTLHPATGDRTAPDGTWVVVTPGAPTPELLTHTEFTDRYIIDTHKSPHTPRAADRADHARRRATDTINTITGSVQPGARVVQARNIKEPIDLSGPPPHNLD